MLKGTTPSYRPQLLKEQKPRLKLSKKRVRQLRLKMLRCRLQTQLNPEPT